MILLIHIAAALSSLIYATYLFMRPAKNKFYVSYGLILLTLLSGTYLTISTHAQLLHACETGLIYIAAVLLGTIAAWHKLAVATENITKR